MLKNYQSPATLPVDPSGVRCSRPWSGYKDFREGRYTYTIDHWNHRTALKADLS